MITRETTSVSLRRDLSQTANEFADGRAAQRFIARQVAPIARVAETEGRYPVWCRENFKKRPTQTNRASGAGYERIGAQFNQLTYACEEHGLEFPLDDRNSRKYTTWLDFEQYAARVLRFQLLQEWEIRGATLFNSGIGLTNTNVATAWSDTANADPVTDIIKRCEAIEQNSGVDRSEHVVVIPSVDYREAMATDAVRELIKYTYGRDAGIQPQLLRTDDFARMVGVRRVLRASSYYDSAQEGITESNAAIWPAGVIFVAVVADEGDPLDIMSAARTMLYDQDGVTDIPLMERYRDESVRSEILRGREDTDEVATAAADLLAQKLTNT